MTRYSLILILLALALPVCVSANGSVTAFHRSGQTFISWKADSGRTPGTYRVYRSDLPISDLSLAEVIADAIEPDSGNDFIAARIATKEKRTEAPRGFIIRPLGLPIPVGSGLYVHTVPKSGVSYYAVVAISADGKANPNALTTGPVAEKVATPEPYLEKVETLASGKVARTYIHWSDKSIAYRESIPFKFVVTRGKDVKTGVPAPMILAIHAYSGYAMPSDGWGPDFVVVCPDDFTKGLPFDGYDWWYGYNSNLGGDLTKGINHNYTEWRLLYTMDFVRRKWSIDDNRVYLRGSSMGGTGAVAFGLRHPEIFAAIFANVPQVNPAMDNIGWSQQNIEKYCGTRAEAVKTNEGVNVWERLNTTKYVSENHGDFPFLRTINARDDQVLKWPQIPGFLKALNDSHHGFVSGWGLGMHNIQPSQVPAVVKDFDIFRIRKNESFPAFSNSSTNDDPGVGDPKVGIVTGQMGGGFDWKILADTPDAWESEIKVIADGKVEAVTDITPRRLQQFKPKSGQQYQWTITDHAGGLTDRGTVTADQWGLITVPQVKVTSTGCRIRIAR